MEAKWIGVTAIAPIAWGANYLVTRTWLPADEPLWGSALRALPAGLLLLLVVRALPRGVWWWRSVVLGTLNVGAFFLLIYLSSQLLPSSVAASIMALSPFALATAGRWVLGEALTARLVLAGATGVIGVLLLIGGARGHLSPAGVLSSVSALVMFALGAVLSKKWRDDTPLLASTAWQLAFGGVTLALAAGVVEGAPSFTGASTHAALAFTSLVATALAFVCWFAGLAHLPAGVVGVIGLLNPVTGVLLGTLFANESLSAVQVAGIALTLAGIILATRPGVAVRTHGLPSDRPHLGAPSGSRQSA